MIHIPPLIADLALILAAAGVITIIFKFLKQPLVLGYIIAGLFIGPHITHFPGVTDETSIRTWAEIGVIFLLFSLGLEFSFKKLVKVGAPASITAVFEVAFMLLAGYVTGLAMGWSQIDSIFLGGILSISSTTIIIKAFEELGVKTQKFAGLVFGVLIVEDLVAILLLVLLSTLAVSMNFSSSELLTSVLKLGFFLILWFLCGIFIIPPVLKAIRNLVNDEIMLIVSLALCLGMVLIAVNVGFSPALGAFIMGSILAETIYAEKIEHLIKPVKDLFAAVFFVSVGMLINPETIVQYAGSVAIITCVTIFGKFISTMIGALISGQQLKHSVQAGMSLSQIGEFSFIIATLGLTLKVTSDFLYPIAVAISAVTTFSTPYMVRLSLPFYNFLQRVLPKRILNAINRYSIGTQTINTTSDWKIYIRSYTMNLIVNSVIIISIIIISSRYLHPFIVNEIINSNRGLFLTVAISLILMLPFLWGLTIKKIQPKAYSRLSLSKKYRKEPLIILEIFRVLLGLFFLSFLLSQFFSAFIAIGVTLAFTIFIALYFSSRLQRFYGRVERRFIKNLNAREDLSQKAITSDMIPWDGHIAEFKISDYSPVIGGTLSELGLREKFGINIAMIQRGSRDILIPQRDERIYPGDELAVIGTDEQLSNFKKYIESPEIPENDLLEQPVVLRRFHLGTNSSLNNKSIRGSGIREKAKALVVGIERNGEQILNPESDFVFEKGDIIWIVGNQTLINQFIR